MQCFPKTEKKHEVTFSIALSKEVFPMMSILGLLWTKLTFSYGNALTSLSETRSDSYYQI